jgi:hypothetical protein
VYKSGIIWIWILAARFKIFVCSRIEDYVALTEGKMTQYSCHATTVLLHTMTDDERRLPLAIRQISRYYTLHLVSSSQHAKVKSDYSRSCSRHSLLIILYIWTSLCLTPTPDSISKACPNPQWALRLSNVVSNQQGQSDYNDCNRGFSNMSVLKLPG